jgi:hypothetical protein
LAKELQIQKVSLPSVLEEMKSSNIFRGHLQDGMLDSEVSKEIK